MKNMTPIIDSPNSVMDASTGEIPPYSDAPLSEVLKHHWPLIKATIKENYVVLTDDDLDYCEGAEEELLERLEHKIGRPREEFIELMLLTEAGCC